MVSEASDPEASSQAHRSRRFWLHFTDNLFRRWFLYLIPIVVAVAAGALMVQNSQDEFTSSATLDASNNPLVGELDLRGDDPIFRQTRAESTANFINEQLRTDAFASAVADAAGLDALIADGVITQTIRGQISVRANGDSIIIIESTWGDPNSAQQLTQATIDTYLAYVSETVASDSLAAEQFFTELLERAIERRDAAQDELNAFVDTLPPTLDGEAQSIEATLTIQRLQGALDRARTSVEEAEAEIQAAQLAVAQAQSEAGLSVRLIDPPSRPLVPNSQLFAQLGLIALLGILGFAVSAAVLLIVTAFDQTVRFEVDVSHHTGSSFVAAAPLVKSLKGRRRTSGGQNAPPGKKSKRTKKTAARSSKPKKSAADASASSGRASRRTSAAAGAPTERSKKRESGDAGAPPPPPDTERGRATRRDDRHDSPADGDSRHDEHEGAVGADRSNSRRRNSSPATRTDSGDAVAARRATPVGDAHTSPDDDALADVEQ